MFVEHVPLQPNLRIDCCAHRQSIATQRTLINEDFELDALEIEVNPEELASGLKAITRPDKLQSFSCAARAGAVFSSGAQRVFPLPRRTRARYASPHRPI